MKTNSFSVKARGESFVYAFKGIYNFFREEPNAVIHLLVSLAVGMGIFYFHVSKSEILGLVLAMGFVWVAEIFNTVVEKIVDFISPEYNRKAGLIKDMAAAAVLISALTAAITGAFVFIPKIF